jgi:hypothetical protein
MVDFNAAELVMLEEACRVLDRLEWLHAGGERDVAAGDTTVTLKVDDVDRQILRNADLLRKLLAALRVPDKHGRRPQRRAGARPVGAP